jgi:hypothetical protein
MVLSLAFRWDPKKRMTPEEAVHHEWLQPSSSSSTFIITSSTSASSLMKHSRDQLKENDQSQQQILQKYQRSQPITPLTILPQIKTPSNRVSQRYNNSNTINGTKDSSRVKGEKRAIAHRRIESSRYRFLSVLAASASELDVVQQQKQYQIYQQQNIRKLSTNITSNNNNNNNTMQHSTISNTSSSSSSSLTGGSGKYGMSHSQSTGDVSAIFGRA